MLDAVLGFKAEGVPKNTPTRTFEAWILGQTAVA